MEESKAKKKATEDELFPERFRGAPVYPGAPDTTARFYAPSAEELRFADGEEWTFTSPDERYLRGFGRHVEVRATTGRRKASPPPS